jgi:hypothetical protein
MYPLPVFKNWTQRGLKKVLEISSLGAGVVIELFNLLPSINPFSIRSKIGHS